MGDSIFGTDRDSDRLKLGPNIFGLDREKIVDGVDHLVDLGMKKGESRITSIVDAKFADMLKSPGLKPSDVTALEGDRVQLDRDIKLTGDLLSNLVAGVVKGEALDRQVRRMQVDDASKVDLSTPVLTSSSPTYDLSYSLTSVSAHFDLDYLAKSSLKKLDIQQAVTELDWKPKIEFKATYGIFTFTATGSCDWEILGPNRNTFGWDFSFTLSAHW